MLELIFSILSSSIIAWMFKSLGMRQIAMLPTIVINYFTCSLTGIIHQGGIPAWEEMQNWFIYAPLLGVVFVGTFYAMGLTAQKFSPAVTMISAKMSLGITVVVAMLLWNEQLSAWGWLGVILALGSVPLVAWKPEQLKSASTLLWLLPAISFLGSALIDSLLNFLQRGTIATAHFPSFLAFLFGSAGVAGSIGLGFSRKSISWSWYVLPAGILLGLINYASIYFLMAALQNSGWSSALLFTMNNMGILLLTQGGSLLFFKEKLNKLNLLGISAALLALVLLFLK